MSEIEIEIDGKKLLAKPNEMVIQVADANNIYIPRFCYHKHLSIAANCRMCLVEVEKAPKPAPACATPVMPGMKVFTRSAKALAAQKAVMEFLLINHPLDCPICDQGGECELQDISMGFGSADSFYTEGKRAVADENLGPLIATEMTRCILCTRCVRFGNEVAGLPELGVTWRGEGAEISTYIHEAIKSEVSGNVIDLCPVGALTSKPFRFKARAWELQQYPSIAAHDCVGSNINMHTRNGEVMRVVPRENNKINLTWISDRDRFSYQGLYHPDRIRKPLVKVEGHWKETDWQTAIDIAVGKLQKTLSTHGVKQLAALASPNSTLEEFYLLQKILRELGSSNIDHRLRQVDFSDQEFLPLFPGLEESFSELENADAIILIGSNIQKEQPLAALRVRKAALKGATIIAINCIDYAFNFKINGKEIIAPQELPYALANFAKALGADLSNHPSDHLKQLAGLLREKSNVKILLGAQSLNHPEAATIRALTDVIAKQTQGKVGYLTEGCNAAGAWIAGCVPHRTTCGAPVAEGLNAQTMLSEKCKAYLLLNVESNDVANPFLFENALKQAETIIALSTFTNPLLENVAHVILPVAPFTETSGTFINASGEWQSFKGAATPFAESRPAWKVLRVLANWLHLSNFEYKSSEEVRDEMVLPPPRQVKNALPFSMDKIKKPAADVFYRIAEVLPYSIDNLTRRGEALQKTQVLVEKAFANVRLHPSSARKLNLHAGDYVKVFQQSHSIELPVELDERIPLHAALIPSGIEETSALTELYGEIKIEKVN